MPVWLTSLAKPMVSRTKVVEQYDTNPAANPAGWAFCSKGCEERDLDEHFERPERHEPIFNIPRPVLAMLAAMIGVHVVLQLMPEERSLWWLLAMAFIPGRYAQGGADLPGGEVAGITSFVTHLFVHADVLHLTINGAWLLAFGTPIAKRLGALRFFLFTFSCGIAGALFFLALHPGLMSPVIGASGAIAGLMGAALRFLFGALDSGQGPLLRSDPASIVLTPLRSALSDRRIIIATAAFVALNLFAMIGFGLFGSSAGAIAWEAHLGGYFFGLFAYGFFDAASQRVAQSQRGSPTNVA